MGVDELIADVPQSWFAAEAGILPPADSMLAPAKTPLPNPTIAGHPAPESGGAQLVARELARTAASLGELRALLGGFEGCALKKTAAKLCFARGSGTARVMLIGEAPGRDEDLQGAPFVGRAGQLLDRMLAAIELAPEDVYITNLVFWRPPGNRVPSPEEVQICRPFLERQIELVGPEILVLLGGAAAKELTGAAEGIMRLRGKWLSYSLACRAAPIRAMATLHPAYLLRSPIAKRLAWRDLLLIREALDANKAACEAAM